MSAGVQPSDRPAWIVELRELRQRLGLSADAEAEAFDAKLAELARRYGIADTTPSSETTYSRPLHLV